MLEAVVYIVLGAVGMLCMGGLAVVAVGIRDVARNRSDLIQVQRNKRRKEAGRKLVELKGGRERK